MEVFKRVFFLYAEGVRMVLNGVYEQQNKARRNMKNSWVLGALDASGYESLKCLYSALISLE